MKIASLLSYIATASLVAFVGSFFFSLDVVTACAAFTTSLLALNALRDYSPRSRFVVTTRSAARPNRAGRELALRALRRGQARRATASRSLALSA